MKLRSSAPVQNNSPGTLFNGKAVGTGTIPRLDSLLEDVKLIELEEIELFFTCKLKVTMIKANLKFIAGKVVM